MATPKLSPPRPTKSLSARAAWPAASPPASSSKPIGRVVLAKKPTGLPVPVREELRSVDFEAVEELADPIDVLFDAMEDLLSVETSVEAGAVCLASLVRAIPSRGGIVHFYDAELRELVAVYAIGPHAERLVLTRASESDSLIGAAFRKHEPIVVNYRGPQAPRPTDRHAFLGVTKNVMVCPILDGPRFLGALELVDAMHPGGFDIAAQHAISYVADRFAGFLVEHGVVHANVVAPPSGFLDV
ncbi:MAG: GAF domain-containing protein [Polyangiaceae bacterium]